MGNPYRVPATVQEARELLAYYRAHNDRRGNYVPLRLRALDVGQSDLFTQYSVSSQVSMAIQYVRATTGRTFTCSRELDLVYGTPKGLRVTRLT